MKRFLGVGLVLAAAIALTGCSTQSTSASAPVEAAATQQVVQLNVQATDLCCAPLTRQALAQVLTQMPGVVKVVPVTDTLYKVVFNSQKTTLQKLQSNILTSTGYQAQSA